MSQEVRYALGIDIGGTTTKTALIDSRGGIISIRTIPTERHSRTDVFVENLLAETDALCKETPAGRKIQGIGISVAGFIDDQRTSMIFNPNIPALEGYPLTPKFEQRFDLPVSLEVDSNSATLGEYYYGAGRGSDRFMCLAIGTGVGGGMTIKGKLLRFTYQCMGDMGHVIVEPEGPACGVGCSGCAEAMVSAPAIVRRAEESLSANQDSILADIYVTQGELDTRDVIAAAQQGDAYAAFILNETGYWLGLALASLAPLFLPDCIAIAGGVSEAGDLLLKPARRNFRANSGSFYHENVKVRKAKLGWKATVLGAAVPYL